MLVTSAICMHTWSLRPRRVRPFRRSAGCRCRRRRRRRRHLCRRRRQSTHSSPSSRRPPGPSAYATGRSDVAVRPAYRTSGAALCRTPCSRAPPCQLAPMCRCDRNQPRWRPVALSAHKMHKRKNRWGRGEEKENASTATRGEKLTGLMGSWSVQHLRRHTHTHT